MKKLVLPAILLAALFVHTGASGQSEKNVSTQRLIWLGYNNKFRITNNHWIKN